VHILLLFFISYIPGLLWVWFFYRRDRREPEPKYLIFRTFFLGMLMVIPAGLIESFFHESLFAADTDLLVLFFSTVFVIGLVEEYSKYAAVRFSVYGNDEFNEVMDGIVYMVTAALGFAATENLFYTLAFGLQIGLVRAFVTPLAHASFSGIVGFYLGLARFSEPGLRIYLIGKGLAIAIFLHGLYDFLLLGGLANPAYVGFIIIGVYFYLLRKIELADRFSPF